MIKKIIIIIILIILVTSFAGCWDRTEPKEIAIITSALYDVSESGDFRIILESINPLGYQPAGTSDSAALLYTVEGESISEALSRGNSMVDRQDFGQNNNVRFMSEKFAKTKVNSLLEFIIRDRLSVELPLLIVVKDDDVDKVFKTSLGFSPTVGNYINSLSKEQTEQSSRAVYITSLKFMQDVFDEGKQPVAGVVEFSENELSNFGPTGNDDDKNKKNIMYYKGLAVFKDVHFLGYLNEDETRVYNVLNNEVKHSYIYYTDMKDEIISAHVEKTKCRIKANFVDGRAVFNIKVDLKLVLTEITDEINLQNKNDVKELEVLYSKEFKKEIEDTINHVIQDYKSDIFGFGTQMHVQKPKYWKKIKDKWDDEYFVNADFRINVDAEIIEFGEATKPYYWEKDRDD